MPRCSPVIERSRVGGNGLARVAAPVRNEGTAVTIRLRPRNRRRHCAHRRRWAEPGRARRCTRQRTRARRHGFWRRHGRGCSRGADQSCGRRLLPGDHCAAAAFALLHDAYGACHAHASSVMDLPVYFCFPIGAHAPRLLVCREAGTQDGLGCRLPRSTEHAARRTSRRAPATTAAGRVVNTLAAPEPLRMQLSRT